MDKSQELLQACVDYYADISNWDTIKLPDNGKKARETLKQIEKINKDKSHRNRMIIDLDHKVEFYGET